MFRIILTVITLALIVTSCNSQKGRSNFHFNYENTPDHSSNDHGSIIGNNPIAREIPEPPFLFSYALIPIFFVMIKKK